MRKLIAMPLSFLLLAAGTVAAQTVRYVSHDGSNEAPYLTPETAARAVGDAVDLADSGDIVLVAPGVYPDERGIRMKPWVTLEGNPRGASVRELGPLCIGDGCQLKDLAVESAHEIFFEGANTSTVRCSFTGGLDLCPAAAVTFLDCHFAGVRVNCVTDEPIFMRCSFTCGWRFDAGDGVFYQCSFIDTHGSPQNGLFIECVAGRESGFIGGNREDHAVFKHCTLGYLCFEGFLLVEDCIIRRIRDAFPERALHNCILQSGEVSEEALAASNSRFATPVFAGWVAYEDTGVYVAPGGDPGGDGTEQNPLPLVSSGLYQTYDYHLVAGSPGIGEATDGRSIGAYPDADPVPRGTENVVVNIAPGRYVDYLPDLYRTGQIHLRKHGDGTVRIELPREGSFYADEAVTLEGITFAGGRVGGRARIVDCVFEGSPDYGLSCGGPEAAPVLISRCRFEGNAGAGALVYRDRVAMFDNCVFTGNGTGLHGYGLAIARNSTITRNNRAISGKVEMTNSIVWGNQLLSNETPCGLAADYCLIQGGYPGQGNIDADPQFIDPENGGFRLLPDSPCIDAGQSHPDLAETDIAGMHRIMFGGNSLTVDMGAYEYYINDLELDESMGSGTLTWSSLAGKSYSIFYSGDLLDWDLAVDNVPAGGDMTTSWIDDGSKTGVLPPLVPRRFYRILENP